MCILTFYFERCLAPLNCKYTKLVSQILCPLAFRDQKLESNLR